MQISAITGYWVPQGTLEYLQLANSKLYREGVKMPPTPGSRSLELEATRTGVYPDRCAYIQNTQLCRGESKPLSL